MRKKLIKILSKNKKLNLDNYTVVVFGAGNTSVLYQKCFSHENIQPLYYVDNSPAKQNTIFQGKPVISLEKLISLKQTFPKPILVLINSQNIDVCNQIYNQLEENNLQNIKVDEFVFKNNKDYILEIYDSLEDDLSKTTYANMILSRILNIPVKNDIVDHFPYFNLHHFAMDFNYPKEIFVDLGAYTGDSIEKYINKNLGVFDKIYAFEPDKNNFMAMQHRVSRLKLENCLSEEKIILENAGVGLKTEKVFFAKTQNSSESGGGVDKVLHF
ncbi:hypothetical protein FACS1894102_0540 [Spirochaetia bacterium]|nr:hypothetical protein FACS1894102_0540 [Spirochaetia bacterium]